MAAPQTKCLTCSGSSGSDMMCLCQIYYSFLLTNDELVNRLHGSRRRPCSRRIARSHRSEPPPVEGESSLPGSVPPAMADLSHQPKLAVSGIWPYRTMALLWNVDSLPPVSAFCPTRW